MTLLLVVGAAIMVGVVMPLAFIAYERRCIREMHARFLADRKEAEKQVQVRRLRP